MKTPIKKSSKHLGPIFVMVVAISIWVAGCAEPTPKSVPDPLAGWKVDLDHDPDQIIEKDYQEYIEKLSTKERNSHGPVLFLKDGTGRQAIRFETGINGTSWSHILIYDKEGKRIKVLKYISGHYAS